MAGPCSRSSPLARSGLTQAGRRRAELGPDYFRIDERDVADLIMFGRRYAAHIRYYPAPRPDGTDPDELIDWSRFFESDVSASLAALAKLPVEQMSAFHGDLQTWLKADPMRDPQQLAVYAKLNFHLPLALLGQAGEIAGKLPQNEPLRAQVAELARRELARPIESLIAWYKGASAAGPLQIFPDEGLEPADYKLGPVASDTRLRLPALAQAVLLGRKTPGKEPLADILVASIEPGDWQGIWKRVKADDTPYRDGGTQVYERIYDALEYNLMEAAIRSIYQSAARLKREAEAELARSLERFSAHEPHYGLWLAFLRLFRHAQQTLNGFTGRHLDFYFREILQLRAREAVPDRVHLLFELAKSVDAVRIAKGTAFRAGDDAQGKPVTYALEQDLIVNRGKVAALHSLRIDPVDGGFVALASSEPRSLDGTGKEPLPPDRPQWAAFGPAAPPKARVGFAVSDPKLFLREGARTIKLTAEFARSVSVVPGSDAWRVRLTGPEGWWEPAGGLTVILEETEYVGPPDHRRLAHGWKGARARPRIEFRLELPADAPPILPFDPALHGQGGSNDGFPHMEIILDFERSSAAASFASLSANPLRKIDLEVGATGIKQLTVVAGGATVDPSKPFAPFGPHPRAGAALIVGSSEIFSKPLSNLELTLDWQEEYSPGAYFRSTPAADYSATEAVLVGGQWQPGASYPLFASGQTAIFRLKGACKAGGFAPQQIANPDLAPSSVSGFARLSLDDDFGHAEYPAEHARALVKLAKGEDYDPPTRLEMFTRRIIRGPYNRRVEWEIEKAINNQRSMPYPPYDPMVTRIEAAYRTEPSAPRRFTHLMPFGEAEASVKGGKLFPDFNFAGALYLGISDFTPPARLSLLVQVADGSGDPLKKPPKLDFDYLAGDQWKSLEERSVDDKSYGFTSSGLLGLALPSDADRDHRAMPSGLHWVRISVDADTDALNRLLSIDAQAGRALFVDNGNDPAFLATPLPAGTIAKFVQPDPKVKKLLQPYSSFGGRPVEAGEDFATRVAERLRHKDRAVAAFDYEALILEAFPKLYRAKCLTTTAMVRDETRRIVADNEVSPGAVTVVTVPWTHGVNSRDPLRPYADQALLGAVDRFLRARVSPFVRLEVQNPKFEEVQASFKVRFHHEIADIAFHREELNAALVAFLTPWSREGGGDIMFGGKLWKSALIDFVEERPEVDFVTDFQLYHKPDADAPEGDWTPVDIELIEATTARSILVSAPRHLIEEVGRNA